MTVAGAALRPFNKSGYEVLADDLRRGEVVIWSVDPVAPRLGDVYLIESDGRPYDVTVERLTQLKGGWSATCKVEKVRI